MPLACPSPSATKPGRGCFHEVRQPEWWGGGRPAAPGARARAGLQALEAKLTAGDFVITAEVSPPLAGATDEIVKKLNLLRGHIDAVNFTDNPSATPRMSSLVCSAVAVMNGVEPGDADRGP